MKTYILSQLTFHLYLEETSPGPLESLNKLIIWYLYSKDSNTISNPEAKSDSTEPTKTFNTAALTSGIWNREHQHRRRGSTKDTKDQTRQNQDCTKS
ncbi:hypothetical protein CYY_010035 [Polysphondylium violaceum]|uniref:Uncharacterized protein n=1 Tax=Polysphondylium violaceum TaxID=133409 RepID=A0A8J4V2D2_9MYCE|nr:hypothetical protein CYY_010035 [Polysphondylium violaceum]